MHFPSPGLSPFKKKKKKAFSVHFSFVNVWNVNKRIATVSDLWSNCVWGKYMEENLTPFLLCLARHSGWKSHPKFCVSGHPSSLCNYSWYYYELNIIQIASLQCSSEMCYLRYLFAVWFWYLSASHLCSCRFLCLGFEVSDGPGS